LFKVVHYRDVPIEEIVEEGAKGIQVRWLISKSDGAENFAMRFFEVEPGGYTPHHSHDWEHEVFILSGEGVVVCEGEEREIREGYVVFVPPGAKHCFKNTGKERLIFLCLIPHK
jgi:quercetin dioxygenase-like cupin family protein